MQENCAPRIVGETEDFAVVFKPPRMHSAPLRSEGGTLLDWYAAAFPPAADLRGRKIGEGGLLHRLDFETSGLVLFAKNQKSLDCLLAQQAAGKFAKEYSALCRESAHLPSSFPPPPAHLPVRELIARGGLVFVIESFFRPFGPGRKQVRPVVAAAVEAAAGKVAHDRGVCYRTEITAVSEPRLGEGDLPGCLRFAAKLTRGFRHQVRCHLAWIGFPILNDPLYGEPQASAQDSDCGAESFLALFANALSFSDPSSGEPREYRIAPQNSREAIFNSIAQK